MTGRGGQLASNPMVKVYAASLVIGIIGLLVVLMGSVLAENMGQPERDPMRRIGTNGKYVIGAVLGFGVGGVAAEFSPLDFSWQIALLIAIGATAVSLVWVRYSVRLAER